MTKIREILERNGYGNGRGNNFSREELMDKLDQYFEDVTFTLETIEDMPQVPRHLAKKVSNIRRDLVKIGFEIKKEFG